MGKRRSGAAQKPGDAAIPAAIAAVRGRLEAIGAEMADVYRNQVPAYMGMRDRARIAEIEETSRAHADAVLAHLEGGTALSEEELRQLGEVGRRRFEQGVPLPDLIHAYELGTRAILDAVDYELKREAHSPEHHSVLIEPVATGIHELSTHLLAAVRRAYHEAERTMMVSERAFRCALDDLLDGETIAGEGARAPLASVIGMMPGERHVIAIIELSGIPDERARREHLQRLAGPAAAPPAAAGRRWHPVAREQDVVVFVAFDGWEDNRPVAAALETMLQKTSLPAGARALAAVGECEPGIEGIGVSHRQARETLSFLRGKETLTAVMTHRDVLPYLMISRVPPLASEILRRGAERVALHDAANGTELIHTLDVYLSNLGNVAEAAKQFHVHRHTLGNRLRQIEQITGMNMQNREDLRLLDLGLMALRIFPARAAS